MSNIALIDQGTSSTKLIVFELEPNQPPKEVFRRKMETRLGSDLNEHNGMIAEEAIRRTTSAIRELKKLAEEYKTESIQIISTEVLRKAHNAGDVKNAIETETGIKVKILDHDEEAQVFWHGVTSDFTWSTKVAAMDIGGGSIQFMYGTKEKLENHVLMKTGSLFLRNNFIKGDAPTLEEYNQIESCIRKEINHLPQVQLSNDVPLIHGSTSVLNFYKEAGVAMIPFHHSPGHPFKTDLTETRRLYEEMRLLPQKERIRYFPSEPGFTDGACPGLANLLLLAEKFGITYELPSNANLLSGIATLIGRGEY